MSEANPALLKLLFAVALLLTTAEPKATIRGRVTLRGTDEPIAGLRVVASFRAYSVDGNPYTKAENATDTDENGRYDLTVSHTATYTVSTSSSAANRIFVPETSGPVRIDSALQMETVDFGVTPGKPVRVTARFIDGLGHRYPHMDWVWGSLLTKSRYVNTSSFDIENVLPETYVLRSQRLDEIMHRAETAVSFAVRDKDVTVDIVSEGSYAVEGFLRFEHSRPHRPPIFIRLSRVIDERSDPAVIDGFGNFVDPIAGFSIRDVPAGLYRLTVPRLPAPLYVKAAMRGREDVLNKGVQVPGRNGANIILSIADDGAAISGTVYSLSGEPARAAKVVLVPEPANNLRTDLYRPVITDAFGKFVIQSVAPGKYGLYAWKTLANADYFDADFIRRYSEKRKALEVGSKAQLIVDLQASQ